MSDAESTWDKVKTTCFLLVLIGIGVAMMVWPDVGESGHPRRVNLIGLIIIWIWSLPAGIILSLLGALGLYGTWKSDS